MAMIDLYYWTTPNGHKISIMLEEAKLAYRVKPINIGRGEQFDPEFLTIAPNNRIPAIVDHAPKDGGQPLSMFESGAILEYLADKSGLFLPAAGRERYIVLQWLHWQMGGLGPMAGQNHHFCHYAPQKIEYAIERYVRETNRLYSVLDQRLAQHTYVGGDDYSIADMAIYPWIVPWEKQGQTIDEFPDLERWFEMIKARPAVRRAYALVEEVNPQAGVQMDEQARKHLFGNR
jgi:GST-like protein